MRHLLILLKKRLSRQPAGGRSALVWVITLMGLALAMVAHSVFGSTSQVVPVRKAAMEQAVGESRAAEDGAPQGLQAELEQLAARTPGRNAVLVRSVDDGWVAGLRGATTFPQGSLRRIWLGAVLLEAVDQGELSLDQRVPLLAGSRGSELHEQVSALLRKAVAQDDRSAQDEILAGLMGPSGMAAWMERRGFGEVAFGPSNKDLARLPQRKAVEGGPPDGATPDGMAFALGELFAGRVLKEDSTAHLLQLLDQGGSTAEPAGWEVSRLTGVSPLTGPAATAGAVAFIRARTGQRYVVVVFTSGADNPRSISDTLLTDAIAALQRY
ncbi:MAG: serine hydrolase [Novosphingobium sp.]